MLKRSFAEFHAQRAAPEALEALQKGQERLSQLRARPWPHSFQGTSRQEVDQYHSVGRRIEELSGELQVRRQTYKALLQRMPLSYLASGQDLEECPSAGRRMRSSPAGRLICGSA